MVILAGKIGLFIAASSFFFKISTISGENFSDEIVCRSTFFDLQSRWYLSSIVVMGTPSHRNQFNKDGLYNVTIKVVRSLKQGYKLPLRTPITLGPFWQGEKDKTRCLAGIRMGRKYIFFMERTDNPLHFSVRFFPDVAQRTKLRKIRQIQCQGCVTYPKIIQLEKTIDRKSNEGIVQLILRCKAEGRPQVLFRWFKDGQPFEGKAGRSIRNTKRSSRIRIDQSNLSDSGTYMCIARNLKGQVQKTVLVTPTELAARSEEIVEPVPIIPVRVTKRPNTTNSTGHYVSCPVKPGEEPFCFNGGRCVQRFGTSSLKSCICPMYFHGPFCEKFAESKTTLVKSASTNIINDKNFLLILLTVAVIFLCVLMSLCFCGVCCILFKFRQRLAKENEISRFKKIVCNGDAHEESVEWKLHLRDDDGETGNV